METRHQLILHLDRINFDELEELFVEDIEFEEPKDLKIFCGFLRKLRSLRHLKLYIKIDLVLLKVILNKLPMLRTLDFGPARIQPIPSTLLQQIFKSGYMNTCFKYGSKFLCKGHKDQFSTFETCIHITGFETFL